MIDPLTIQAQRDELQARIDRARLAYADLEVARDQALASLAELTRHLDGMAGAIQALDSVLAQAAPISTNGMRERLIGIVGKLPWK